MYMYIYTYYTRIRIEPLRTFLSALGRAVVKLNAPPVEAPKRRYAHTYIYTCIHTYIYTYIFIHLYMHMDNYTFIYIYISYAYT